MGKVLGRRLKRLREAHELTQRGLECPGVSYAYISRIEAGEREPSYKALVKLAAKLDTTALYLMTGMDDIVCPVCLREP